MCDFSFREKLPKLVVRNVFFGAMKLIGIVKILAWKIMNRTEGEGDTSNKNVPGPIPPLNLKPGERVKVKSYEEIQETLDQNCKYQGLSFTVAQRKYCGRTYTVLKRLEKVFDERRWKLSKIRDTVLLDGVVCDGAGGISREWDGCDRYCLLWWKEAWLERVDT